MRWLLIVCVLAGAACATRPLATPSGAGARFYAQLSDKPTLVAFMTAWCEACRHEAPALVRWARAHQGGLHPTAVLVVMSGSGAQEVPALARERQLDPALVSVLADPDGAIADRFGITATPTLIVFAGSAAHPGPAYRAVDEVPEPAEPDR